MAIICPSVCRLRFIIWSFLKASLQLTLDQFNGATSRAENRSRSASPNSCVMPTRKCLIGRLRTCRRPVEDSGPGAPPVVVSHRPNLTGVISGTRVCLKTLAFEVSFGVLLVSRYPRVCLIRLARGEHRRMQAGRRSE
jgi:hypothetical protein